MFILLFRLVRGPNIQWPAEVGGAMIGASRMQKALKLKKPHEEDMALLGIILLFNFFLYIFIYICVSSNQITY